MNLDDLVDDPPDDDVQYIARTLKIPVEEARRVVENLQEQNRRRSEEDPLGVADDPRYAAHYIDRVPDRDRDGGRTHD